jgi:8-oxo-dGTP pyrophosphatase MutT (NUDIX family)
MDQRRPAPVEEPAAGPATDPRPAASVIVLRDGPCGIEVLLVRRNPTQRFMGGAWVFPGGAIAAGEAPADTAVRELTEEASVAVASAAGLVPFSRWVTPAEVKVRFDTHFFLVPAPAEAIPRADGRECVAAAWRRPGDALEAYARGELELVFPTIRHLEELAGFATVADGLERARGRDLTPIVARVVERDGQPAVLMPGEPGYDD